MMVRGAHGASSSVTSEARKAFLAARAQSDPAIREARAKLEKRLLDVSADAVSAGPSTFSLLYESRDGRLCLFQAEDGHLSAVDSSKLA